MTSSTSLLTERTDDGIEILRINRPEKRNALDTGTIQAINEALTAAQHDADLRAVVISTTSTVALCAGADVGEPLDAAGGVARMEAFAQLYRLVEEVPVPTIAVCVGNTVGAGAEIAAACDFRAGPSELEVVAADARLGVPVGPARLTQLIGLARAKDLVYTGRVVGMQEGEVLGLLQRTAPADEAEQVALELAQRLTGQNPQGLRNLKSMFRELENTLARVDYENDKLIAFQRDGAGLPQG